MSPLQMLFLPGASGRTALWQPVADSLSVPARKEHVGWPGFGSVPPDKRIRSVGDLVNLVVGKVSQPTALIAQSMGGVIAIQAALKQPTLTTHLVLTATSGGVDMTALGGQDWRPSFAQSNPQLPNWFSMYQEDLSRKLPTVHVPTLLLWGDADPISPVRVGEHLASLLPDAQLHIVKGGGHDLAETHAAEIAPRIDDFLRRKAQPTAAAGRHPRAG